MNRFGTVLVCIACILIAGSADFAYCQRIGGTRPEVSRNLEDSLKKQVAFLCSESMKGRKAGSPEEKQAAKYIYDFMQNLGAIMLSPEDGDDFGMANPVTGDTLYSRNIVGFIPGYDPALKGEFIVLGTQLDGPGYESLTVNGVPRQRIFPGAYSNASGTAVLMQVAKLIAQNKFMFRRSVLFGFFGAGNLSQAGSWYFLNRSFKDVDKIKFMVDVNSVGRDSGPNYFQAFVGLPDKHIFKDIFTVGEMPFSPSIKIADLEPVPSDYRSFHSAGISFTLFTTGDNNFRGTIHDTPDQLDYLQLSQIVEFVYSYSLILASKDSFEKQEEETDTDRIYSQMEVDKRASFMKGDERTFLKDWVYHYVKYPDSAIASQTEGTEVAEFVVDKNGKVTDIKITTSLSEDIDKEVLKVLKASPKWTPAQINGKTVPVRISVAIEFRLAQGAKFGINK
ncbi:MAG: TonB family protein [Bacteroidales bacterium]|nr:TonB family protein [Bacteroidales bacterium]